MKQKGQWYGILLLTLTAFIWGLSFVAQSVGMKLIRPCTFQCIRSFMGAAVLIPVVYLRLKKEGGGKIRITREMMKGGIQVGLVLTVACCLQQFAMVTADAGKAAFLTALYLVMVPLFSIFLGKKPSGQIWACVLISLFGVYLLSLSGGGGIQTADILLLLCAVMYAVQILLVDYYVKKMDGIWISFVQLLVSGALTLPPTLLWEKPAWDAILAAGIPLLYAGVLTCGVAYTLQIVGQKYTPPTVATLVMSLESVFAMLGGVLILHQIPSLREGWGCVLVFAAVILSQIPLGALREKRRS